MKYLEVEDRDRISIITLKTGNPLNPLNMDIMREVGEAISATEKVTVINGQGKAFSAGANIADFTKMDSKIAYRFATEGHDIMNSIASSRLPVIAAIHGYALGGGFELALACDFRVSTPGAKMGLPEINLGIMPGFAGTQRLKSIAGEARALDLVSTGRMITAEEAHTMGIVARIGDDHMAEAEKLANELADKPPISLQYVKSLIRARPDSLYDEEKEKFGLVFGTKDSREGFDAFLNKRKPRFTGE